MRKITTWQKIRIFFIKAKRGECWDTCRKILQIIGDDHYVMVEGSVIFDGSSDRGYHWWIMDKEGNGVDWHNRKIWSSATKYKIYKTYDLMGYHYRTPNYAIEGVTYGNDWHNKCTNIVTH